METAGLAVGTLALIGVFEDCVTLLSQIGAAKCMEKDYTLLKTRLNFQKTLLLQWAERLKLHDVDRYDTRLDDPDLRCLVQQGLGCILGLLQDGDVLEQRYGLRPADDVTDVSAAVTDRPRTSLRRRLLSFRPLLKPSNSQFDQAGGSHQSLSKDCKTKSSSFSRIKWVIKDKEQFESLVTKLSDLITDINQVVPRRLDNAFGHTVQKHETQAVNSDYNFDRRIDYYAVNKSKLVGNEKKAFDEKCTKRILDRLWFRLIDDRRNNIAATHSNTYEWAIKPPASGVIWDDLGKWLRFGRDIYWIHGKPGSGKSTLMKFLYNHPETMSSLHSWAGHRTLTMASFFLWNIGSVEQSSQEGLARGLLYHVLEQNPKLIPAVLPHMWQEAQNRTRDLEVLSNTEMETAFENLGAISTNGAFAFFIDGLDEFTGNERDGISFVKSLATSANIKLLVSSRPIDTCIAAFSSAPQLRLQDITRPDIELYINDTVRSHSYVAEYKFVSHEIVQELIEDIQNKADGVFLWVVLACRTLLEGFEAYDSVEEIRRRVEELPPELESLFRHILNGLPTRYLQQAARLLRICYIHRSLQIEDKISAVSLAWAYEKNMETRAMEDFTEPNLDKKRSRTTMFEGRLRSRCRGLLEVYKWTDSSDSHIDFMHRTVFEFLSTPDVWELDCLHISDYAFDASTVLAYMSCYTLYNSELGSITGKDRAFWTAVAYAQEVEQNSPSHMSRLLSRFAFAILHETNYKNSDLSPVYDLSLDTNAILLAIEIGFTTFAQRHDLKSFNDLRKLRSGQESPGYSLLYHAFLSPLLATSAVYQDDYACYPGMIDLLIRAGSDPNDSIELSGNDTRTCWGAWMESKHMVTRKDFRAVDDAEVTMMMIRAGAALIPQNPDDPATGVAHIATEDHRGRLTDAVGQWLKLAPELPRLQDRDKLKALCNEITAAVAASYQTKPS